MLIEHDNRSVDNNRRVSFKKNHYGQKGPQRDWGQSIRAHFENEDIDMGGLAGSGKVFRSNRGKGRPGSPAPRQMRKNMMDPKMRRKLMESPSGWYRVAVGVNLTFTAISWFLLYICCNLAYCEN